MGEEFDLVRNFVSDESIELYLKFFTETAKRSNVRLLGVSPLKPGELFSCIQPDQADFSSGELLPQDVPPEQSQMEEIASPTDSTVPLGPPIADLSRIFNVNRFQLSLRGDYLNVMDYLRYLNQYQQTLSPVCLEVFSTPLQPAVDQSSAAAVNPEPRYVGEVNVRLIVDIPQRPALVPSPPISEE